MSNKRDLEKALKENGFKLTSAGKKVKHLVYSNGSRVVRLHLGSTMSDGLVRKMLGQIKRGSVRDTKADPRSPHARREDNAQAQP